MMRSLIATCLAVLLVFANVACVCAAVVAESPSDHHTHHSSSLSGSDQSSDCPHLDCEGNCGLESFLPLLDRDASPKLSFKSDGGDDLDADIAASRLLEVRLTLASVDPPPPLQNFRASTPVQRKDLLLE